MCKKVFIILFVLALLFGAYWVKCQLGVNLIRGFSWEEHFLVLNVFQKSRYVARPRPGVLLSSSFDGWWPYQPWIDLWAREDGRVKEALVSDSLRGSRCLQVRSSSAQDWSIQHSVAFGVNLGDAFTFEGYARTTELAEAHMSMLTYDDQRRLVKWNFALEKVRSPDWIKMSRRFTVPAGVKYIRFHLTGTGIGEAYFDDIKFVKEK